MENKYFYPVPETLDELKKQYRDLAMRWHPDLGGDTEIMKAINNEFNERYLRLIDVPKANESEAETVKQNDVE